MRLFIYPLILSLALIVGFAEIAAPIVQQRISYNQYTLPVHKTLYLERNVYDNQLRAITVAAMEWYTVTDGQVVFDIKILPQRHIDPKNAIIVTTVTPDFPEILIMDSTNKNTTLALYHTNSGLATIEFVDERIQNVDYTAVALHEMGHSLGLEHPDSPDYPLNGFGSLMFSSIVYGSDHITTLDLKQFCHLYHCDWKKFHGLAEIQ